MLFRVFAQIMEAQEGPVQGQPGKDEGREQNRDYEIGEIKWERAWRKWSKWDQNQKVGISKTEDCHLGVLPEANPKEGWVTPH